MPNTAANYTGIITSEHADKPRFTAMVEAVAQCFVDVQVLLEELPRVYDLDVATGAQLDADALWLGVGRSLKTPISDVYFTFDDATNNVGWDEGTWYKPYENLAQVSILDDESLRLLCKFKAQANSWDGTSPTMSTMLNKLLRPAVVTVTDNQNMTVTVKVEGQPPSKLFKQLLLGGYSPLRPAGVAVNYTFA